MGKATTNETSRAQYSENTAICTDPTCKRVFAEREIKAYSLLTKQKKTLFQNVTSLIVENLNQ